MKKHGNALVLMYHDIVSNKYPTSGFKKVGTMQYTLSEERFETEVRSTKDDNVIYSFDDGGSSFYTIIADILETYGKKGIFFISTKYIDTPNFLTKEQIIELENRGHLIASHSHSHPTKISALTIEECINEWKESKQILESIVNHEITCGAVPGGAVSYMVYDCMIEVGYKTIYTSEPTTVIKQYKGSQIIGRFGITRKMTTDTLKKLITSVNYRRKLLLKYRILNLAKSVLGSNYNKLKQLIIRIMD